MTYRDDLEATQARADAAERRAAELEERLAGERDDTPIVAVPETFQVTSTVHELTIQWRRRHPNGVAPLLVGILLALCGPVLFASRAEEAAVYGVGLTATGVGFLYWGLRLVLNHTTVSVVGEELRVRHGPLPKYDSKTVRIADVKQLFVRKNEREEGRCDYALFAVVDGDRELALVSDLEHVSHALYLERAFEGRLRVKDRLIVGEPTK